MSLNEGSMKKFPLVTIAPQLFIDEIRNGFAKYISMKW